MINLLSTSAIMEESDLDLPEWAPRVIEHVLANFSEDIDLDELAMVASISKYNFCRQFHKYYGLPPLKWVWRFRAVLAAELFKLPLDWTVSDISYIVGFTSPAHFSRAFKEVFGASPTKYRQIHGAVVNEQNKVALDDVLSDEHVSLLKKAAQIVSSRA